MDPYYGVQLHHPRFLECIGAPESARLLDHEQTGRYGGRLAAATRCWLDGLKSTGSWTICDVAQLHIGRGHLFGLWPGTFPLGDSRRSGPGTPSASRSSADVRYGIMVPTAWPGCSRADACVLS